MLTSVGSGSFDSALEGSGFEKVVMLDQTTKLFSLSASSNNSLVFRSRGRFRSVQKAVQERKHMNALCTLQKEAREETERR